jgi:sulfite reductase (NADPH) flavoprotein alpha-component
VYLLGLTSASPQRWQPAIWWKSCRATARGHRAFPCGPGRPAANVQIDGWLKPSAQALATRQLPANRAHLVGLHAQALVNALAPVGMREYSIASIASDGVLELIVRQERHPDGGLGLGSAG